MTANRLVVRVTNTDYSVLDRFDEIIALGKIYGPYANSQTDGRRRKCFWAWVASEAEALETLELLAPWLSDRRLARAYELTGLRFPIFTC